MPRPPPIIPRPRILHRTPAVDLFWRRNLDKERALQQKSLHEHNDGAYENFIRTQSLSPSSSDGLSPPPRSVSTPPRAEVDTQVDSQLSRQLFGLSTLSPTYRHVDTSKRELDEMPLSPGYLRQYTSNEQFREDRLWRQVYGNYGDQDVKHKLGSPLRSPSTSAQEIGWEALHRGNTPELPRLGPRSISCLDNRQPFLQPLGSPGTSTRPMTETKPSLRHPVKESEITLWDSRMTLSNFYAYRERKKLGKPNQAPLRFRMGRGQKFRQSV